MRTEDLQCLLEIIEHDVKRRCEQSFEEQHRDLWGKYHGQVLAMIREMKNGLK